MRFDSQDRIDDCTTADQTGATCRYGWNKSGQGVREKFRAVFWRGAQVQGCTLAGGTSSGLYFGGVLPASLHPHSLLHSGAFRFNQGGGGGGGGGELVEPRTLTSLIHP